MQGFTNECYRRFGGKDNVDVLLSWNLPYLYSEPSDLQMMSVPRLSLFPITGFCIFSSLSLPRGMVNIHVFFFLFFFGRGV